DGKTRGMRLGAVDFSAKPASRDTLREAFSRMREIVDKTDPSILLVGADDVRNRMKDMIGFSKVRITEADFDQGKSLLKKKSYDCILVLPGARGAAAASFAKALRAA